MKVQLEFNSHRSPVMGRGGMVASTQPLATAAGLLVLEKGGSAADAAVATAAALNVTEPMSTGLGGDAFALFYDAKSRKVYSLNGSGRSPRSLTLERLQREGLGKELPARHPYTITVPGACAAWYDAVARFGRLNMAEVLAPAIRLAEEGFPVAPLTSAMWKIDRIGLQSSRSPNWKELTIDGHNPHPGEIFRNPGLARTLHVVADGGKEAFYQGQIGEGIVRAVQAAGGCLTMEDLAAHESEWVEPVSTVYRNKRVWECPPNGQGVTALLALNILEGFDLSSLPYPSLERIHIEIEAMRLAFADSRYFVADPDFYHTPLDTLLSKEYAEQRRKLIDLKRANPSMRHGEPIKASDTVYLSVVDAEGNACSFINSNYWGFGSGIIPQGWGFPLQNRGHNFSLNPKHPNCLAPGKRPYHTIIPAMATDEQTGDLYASFGVMGGFMQPQGHMQVFVALVDDELDPQAALDRPRFCLDVEFTGKKVALEEGIPEKIMNGLDEMGHPVEMFHGLERDRFGRGQIILRDPSSGVLTAGSDPRGDGCAMCLF